MIIEAAGTTWDDHGERGGFFEADDGCGFVEDDGNGRWFAFPNIDAERRFAARGPYRTRTEAMEATAGAFRAGGA